MVVWSGKGILAILVLVASFIFSAFVLPDLKADLGFGITFMITALFCWFMGKRWNQQEAQTFIDKTSGKEVVIKPNHTLFWINIQYWGPIFAVLSIYFLFQKYI
ncbi:hypothetical protein KMW28_22745 [Flammeovirga yaeyamensis]|uniref:Uncharacterized protein n=1 Tax=Flammeovirga yaeyamensis TaxID=367791 RepID=A0AAX1NF78_9BACT|nr:hypothetical protein [Flammeovirga yaeyamensis]MBB3696819.1 hypothetical protein [Flammeovirga yaeyamensis]NMF33484.1 hypothetical protein [Flammeovirga yaeyamensis]QWG05242.1 hypothetical protein KMW28_22745 [Flammeovirga yaeyamensis]